MHNDITIQFLAAGDEHLLENVADGVFDNPIDFNQLSAFLADRRHEIVVAIDNGLIVGFVSSVEYLHPDKQPQMFINEVGVATSHRRRGIGRRLLDAMVDLSRDRNHVYAWLGTENSNVVAQALFNSATDPDDNPQPFLLYEWDLEEERQEESE